MRNAELLRYLILAAQREGNRQLSLALSSLDLTSSQAETIRVLGEFGPLNLRNLGELLICESGNNPSRLVDRLVIAGLVQRDASAHDRREVALSLTTDGQRADKAVRLIEEEFYRRIDDLMAEMDLAANVEFLFALISETPAGTALKGRIRRAAMDTPSNQR